VDAATNVAAFAVVMASAVVAGGQLFCLVAVLPALSGWSSELSAIVHRDALTDRPHRFLRTFAMASVVSAIAFLTLLVIDDGFSLAAALAATGLLAALVSGAISSREWPINEEIKSWGDAPDLARYTELRRIWDVRHVRRTWLSTFALAAFLAAALVADSV